MNMSQSEFEAQLAEIRKAYIASLESKRDSIIRHWDALRLAWDNDTYQSLYLVIHGLAGSARTFDLDKITETARAVIQQFKQHATEPPPQRQAMQLIHGDIERLIAELNLGLSAT